MRFLVGVAVFAAAGVREGVGFVFAGAWREAAKILLNQNGEVGLSVDLLLLRQANFSRISPPLRRAFRYGYPDFMIDEACRNLTIVARGAQRVDQSTFRGRGKLRRFGHAPAAG